MPNPILTGAIDALAAREDLSEQRTAEVLAEIMHGEVSEIQIAGFLIALRTKGETEQELAGLARTMRELAARVPSTREDLLDTAGTGGGRRTFNVSTTAALIAAGAGCAVAKHGNRSATGPSGSADLLEALGARIDLAPEGVARCIEEAGFGFMFAPAHHRATRFVIPVRRELAVRTIFNLLGPLTNPAGATRQLIGVSDVRYLETVAGALARLGAQRALVVCGEDGLDEVSIAGATHVVEVAGESVRRYAITPADAGLRAAPAAGDPALAGGTPSENAALTRAILAGEAPAAATDLAGKAANFQIAVKSVEEAALPDLDEEFCKAFGVTEGGIPQLREDVANNMRRELEQNLRNRNKAAVLDKLYQQNPIDVPNSLIEAQIRDMQVDAMRRSGAKDVSQAPPREPLIEPARRRVALGLILNDIVRREKLTADRARIEARLDEMVGAYGDAAALKRAYQQNADAMRQVESLALEDQVVEWVFAHAKVHEKVSSFKELMNFEG